jgi:hypothetical protein
VAVAGFSGTHSSLRFTVPRTNSGVFLDPISVLDSGSNVQTLIVSWKHFLSLFMMALMTTLLLKRHQAIRCVPRILWVLSVKPLVSLPSKLLGNGFITVPIPSFPPRDPTFFPGQWVVWCQVEITVSSRFRAQGDRWLAGYPPHSPPSFKLPQNAHPRFQICLILARHLPDRARRYPTAYINDVRRREAHITQWRQQGMPRAIGISVCDWDKGKEEIDGSSVEQFPPSGTTPR